MTLWAAPLGLFIGVPLAYHWCIRRALRPYVAQRPPPSIVVILPRENVERSCAITKEVWIHCREILAVRMENAQEKVKKNCDATEGSQ